MITLAHGAGGKSSATLLDAVFLPAIGADLDTAQTDAAVLALPGGPRLAISTDSFVVKPLRLPGGSVGHLAAHGTVNDLAVMRAQPVALSAAFVLEEGFPVDDLREIVDDMAEAAAAVGVSIVTGGARWWTAARRTACTLGTRAWERYPRDESWRRLACETTTWCSARAPLVNTASPSCWLAET